MNYEILSLETAKKLETLEKENKRLNNIIEELEKWLEDNWQQTNDIWYVKIINKLKELKENNNLTR